MTIKSDKWIRKMAQEHGLIAPFEEKQVREGVVSYGLSSYGYDLRVADEFKVFTNINSTIVDPKSFDESSFVNVTGDCLIPPNSFALARTVEYLKIPRDVITVCLGKCVTGDTRVVDASTGEYLPIREFAGKGSTLGLERWQLRPQSVSAFLPQGVKPVFELRTRLGQRIRATANHPLRQLHGWTALEDLRPGDRIAAARTVPVFGRDHLPRWEAALLGLMIAEGQCDTPGHSPTFTTADPTLAQLLEESVAEGLGCSVTYKDHFGYRIVNRPSRGGVMTLNRATEWLRGYGLDVGSAEKFVPQAVFRAPQEDVAHFLRALFSGDGSVYSSKGAAFLEYDSNSRRLVEDVQHLLLRFGIVSLLRERTTQVGTIAHRVQITDRDMIRAFAEKVGFWPGSEKQLRLEALLPDLIRVGRRKSNFDTLPREGWSLLGHRARDARRSLRSMGVPRTMPAQSLPFDVASQVATAVVYSELVGRGDRGPVWDTVASIEPAGEELVYDLTVEGVHNFLANGLVVHNSTYARCGLIVNVTPFEPEWEGHATLEISNTTPLPAKIYANEGLCQVLFFQSDEPCETSYADKKGKYQHQPPKIVLPRM